MGYIDRVPRAGNLNIGGMAALYRTELVREAGISHVLSVIDYDVVLPADLRGGDRAGRPPLRHLHIEADDEPRQNLLQHFGRTNAFIDEGLRQREDGDGGGGVGGVFVHCAMGKSRSATLVCAYLMWKYGLPPQRALDQLCEGRPVCGPNAGFMEQLDVYGRMLAAHDPAERDAIYKEWEQGSFKGQSWEWDSTYRVKL